MFRKLLLISFLLAACSTTPRPTPTASAPHTPPIPATCAAPSEDLTPYFNLADGYCVLYPAHFRIRNFGSRLVNFSGPPIDLTAAPVSVGDPLQGAALTILIEDAAGGRTLSQVVDDYAAQFGAGAPASRTTTRLGGEAAEVVEGIPGRAGSREAFVIHDEAVYHVSAYPLDDIFQARPDVEAVWQAVTTSFAFLPPGFAEAFSNCPTGGDDAAPYLSFTHGFCLLYPSRMSLNVIAATNEIVLSGAPREPGPEAASVNLVVRAGEPANGRSVDQLADEYLAKFSAEQIASVTRAPVTIGGQPGVMLDGGPGLTQTRRAFIAHADRVYELTLSPFDDPALADDQPDAEAAWEMVTTTLVFVSGR